MHLLPAGSLIMCPCSAGRAVYLSSTVLAALAPLLPSFYFFNMESADCRGLQIDQVDSVSDSGASLVAHGRVDAQIRQFESHSSAGSHASSASNSAAGLVKYCVDGYACPGCGRCVGVVESARCCCWLALSVTFLRVGFWRITVG